MKRFFRLDRRGFLIGAAGVALAGCDRISETDQAQDVFDGVNELSYKAQRLLIGADRLAPEFAATEISRNFRANGSIDPKAPSYRELVRDQFTSWKLNVGGLVEKARDYSLDELRALPSRTQITRHDCVEGWSCIGKWKGVLLSTLLDEVRVKPQARYVVFYCADRLGADEAASNPNEAESDQETDPDEQPPQTGAALDDPSTHYYETIDLVDARHPQTILAYDMNDRVLPVAHGAPLRLRVERQLGYKMAKYIMRIELVESFAGIGLGKGGYWEDRGYDWYAGI
ncbi:molybdopterin-dependent oxidoreductase [Methylocella tundrae]|uniref:DMSO/TMAO reductase YedYZ, molybdopterin-dependent catalytic subunit n=1 Tax=Methylocella tundrae TaxID=227605 RepID=A0A4U8YWE3_METTU|nr:molybdopterin-dependent oxidoreductase [Methylocella tundrae]WPP05299.1 molybdopterin-dependent oxidoreductase [Methylocella tundrae]VFU07653.1 DMSO/TMAO reductase YedYZ, molybdopterin-dependent catalytic subunit [Methylocella tundrae]